MKIYTKTGDDGTTGLFGGARVKKASLRVDAYGMVDELNATIGVARATKLDAFVDGVLAQVQVELFTLGAELATVPGKEDKLSMTLLAEGDATRLENAIDEAEKDLPALKSFVLPGGSPSAAQLHVARTVCRRAEIAALRLEGPVNPLALVYLNRLSDLLFILSRVANVGRDEPLWKPGSSR